MFTRLCFLLTALLVAVVPALAQTAVEGAAPSPPGAVAPHRFTDRFNAANTTHDGNLTLAQAQQAHMPMIVRHFSQIDAQSKGYVTMADIRAFRQKTRAGNAPAQ